MKLIYKDTKYPCVFKSQMKKNMWYSMEPAKITLTIPLKDYFNIRTDIKDCDNNFHFRLLINKNDKIGNGYKEGLWMVDSKFERSTISSSFSKGIVKVIFKLHISDREESDKSELRELIINDLFKK